MRKSRSASALTLVDGGLTVAEAAKLAGVSRQAVYLAMKASEEREARAVRTCSECGGQIDDDARLGTMTCSGSCRVARHRRLASAKRTEAFARSNVKSRASPE